MKKSIYLLAIFAGMFFASCTYTVEYQTNVPITMSRAEFEQSARVSSVPQPIENHGKICFYKGFIFLAETGKGIHIINNLDPQHPHRVGFVELIGNADISVRNNVLYADNCTDLVWFSLTVPAVPVLQGRLVDAFPVAMPENGYDHSAVNKVPSNEVIVGWTPVTRTEKRRHHYYLLDGMPSPTTSSTGINGSMSRFSLYRDYLYAVINNQMSIIDLSGATPVKAVENLHIGFDVETIFSYQDKMFMGTPTGMLIYSVADPLQPKYCSSVQHVFGCDPVVVEDDIAYVTVHSSNNCGQNFNELMIIDVSNVYKPVQIASYQMTKPKGLGIDSKTLFVCDDGLKIFNAQNPQTIMAPQNILAHHRGMNGYDVIPFNNILIMIADDGLYQYDYSDLNNISLLSVINW